MWLYVMSDNLSEEKHNAEWFAIHTRMDFKAEETLKDVCEDVLFPKETVVKDGKATSERAMIPHVLFINTTREHALALEMEGRRHPESAIPFWIYRYPNETEIRVIPQSSINLLRLLSSSDTTRCEIFSKTDFKGNEHVRVIGGPYQGQKGYVQRVKKNKHVIVKIEGICLVMLPFIHPDFLERID